MLMESPMEPAQARIGHGKAWFGVGIVPNLSQEFLGTIGPTGLDGRGRRDLSKTVADHRRAMKAVVDVAGKLTLR